MTYSIQPFNITVGTQTYTATSISYSINYTVGATSMIVPYLLLNSTNQLWNGTVEINELELANWGTDDSYMVNLVAQKAGVVLI